MIRSRRDGEADSCSRVGVAEEVRKKRDEGVVPVWVGCNYEYLTWPPMKQGMFREGKMGLTAEP